MDDVVSHDKAYTLELLHALLETYQLEWQEYGYSEPMIFIYPVIFLFVTYLGQIRCYEAVWTDLGTLRYDAAHCPNCEDGSTVVWSIV